MPLYGGVGAVGDHHGGVYCTPVSALRYSHTHCGGSVPGTVSSELGYHVPDIVEERGAWGLEKNVPDVPELTVAPVLGLSSSC